MEETTTHLAPAWTHRAFRRPRLTTQLDHVTARAITLICAPPGTGKTLLVSDWARSRPDLLTAWLDAEPSHNDRDVLCRLMTRRFAALGVLAGPGGIVTDPVDALLARLNGSREPAAEVVAVIDDAHEITERHVWQVISRLILGSPPWLRWIIATRVDPPLGIQRLQLQGRLAQLRSVDLAFDLDETMGLMQWFDLPIPVEAASDLLTWSEGWAAALCLAARAMQGADPGARPWEQMRESESLVLDFLVQEVLDRLSPADRDFLLRISVADLITPDLARQLTGSSVADDRLRRLERTGTFLLETDAAGHRYRYHGLMAALMRARLNDEMPDEARALCHVAARWYSEHGYADEAERHAVRAGDLRLIGNVRASRGLDHLLRTGALLPWSAGGATLGLRDPSLQVLACYEAIRRRDRRAAELALADPEDPAPDGVDHESVRLLQHVVRMEAARWGCVAATGRVQPSPHELLELVEDERTRSALSVYAALRDAEAALVAGSMEHAQQVLVAVEQDQGAADWARQEASALMALIEVSLGDSTRVTTMTHDAASHGTTDASMWLNAAAAVAHCLHGESAGLRARVDFITMARERPRSVLFDRCSRLLVGATALRSPTTPALMDRPSPGLVTKVAVALGIVEGIDRDGRAFTIGGELEATIASARRALSELSLRRMEAHLAPWRSADLTEEHPRSVVELHTLFALSCLHQGHEDEALEWIERAITAAAPCALWGPVVAQESALRRLLERHSWRLGAASPAAVEMLDALRTKFSPPVVMLTDRERAVLHYLPTLMSNHEIAAEMLISVNTVKTHLKAIYRKLGVDRRRDALLRARQVELLSRDVVTRAG